MKHKLKYSSNEFKSRTRKSMEKRYKLFSYHRSKVKKYHLDFPTDADYTIMFDRTEPNFQLTKALYDKIYSIKGAQYGQTEAVALRIKGIKGKRGLARDWYNRYIAIYAKSSPAKIRTAFPSGLLPFNGDIDTVISSVKGLSHALTSDVNTLVVAIKAEVDAEWAIVNPDRELQVTDIGATGKSLKELAALCEQDMDIEYMNAAKVMEKFFLNENDIQESFHDMELLLSKQQTKWDIGLAANETKDIAQRTQIPQSKFRGTVTGGDAVMYLAKTAGGTDGDSVILKDGIENKFVAEAFHATDYGISRHITLVNSSGNPIRFKLFLG